MFNYKIKLTVTEDTYGSKFEDQLNDLIADAGVDEWGSTLRSVTVEMDLFVEEPLTANQVKMLDAKEVK